MSKLTNKERFEEGEARQARKKTLVLGFDAGCSACSALAGRIQRQVGDRLVVRNLRDPEVRRWREEILGKDAPWAPTLFEVGEGKVRAWTGWRMGWALGHALGPAATWRAMQALGEARTVPEISASLAARAANMSRRRFLRGMGGTAVAASVLLGNSVVFSESVSASTSFVKGTAGKRRLAKQIVQRSVQFKRLADLQRQVNASFDFDRAGFRVDSDGDFGIMFVPSMSNKRGASGIFYLDMVRKRVFMHYHHIFISVSNTASVSRVQILSYQNNQKIPDHHNILFEVIRSASRSDTGSPSESDASEQTHNVVTSSGRRVPADMFIAERRKEHQRRVQILRERTRKSSSADESRFATSANPQDCAACQNDAELQCTVNTWAACELVATGAGAVVGGLVGAGVGALAGSLVCTVYTTASQGCDNYANSASGGCLHVCYEEPAGSNSGGVCG